MGVLSQLPNVKITRSRPASSLPPAAAGEREEARGGRIEERARGEDRTPRSPAPRSRSRSRGSRSRRSRSPARGGRSRRSRSGRSRSRSRRSGSRVTQDLRNKLEMSQLERRLEERFNRRFEEQDMAHKVKYEKLEKKFEKRGGREEKRYPAMNNPSHQHQMEFNRRVKDAFYDIEDEVDKLFHGEVPEDLSKMVEKGKELIGKRCKNIAIADGYDHGWATVSEYVGTDLAEDEGDSRRIEDAEKRAARKGEMKKRKDETRRKGEEARARARDFIRRSRSRDKRSKSKGRKVRSKSREKGKGSEVKCYRCDKMGHMSYTCPNKKN